MNNAERINQQLAEVGNAMTLLREAGVDGDAISVSISAHDKKAMLLIRWSGFAKLFRGERVLLQDGRHAMKEWNGIDVSSVYDVPGKTTEITIE